jgi:hypothetical protein
MGDTSFIERSDVRSALDDVVERRLQMTEEGRDDSELPSAEDHLRHQGIEIPEGSSPRLIRTQHESEMEPLAPMCNGVHAIPVNCRWIHKHYVCDWVCPD